MLLQVSGSLSQQHVFLRVYSTTMFTQWRYELKTALKSYKIAWNRHFNHSNLKTVRDEKETLGGVVLSDKSRYFFVPLQFQKLPYLETVNLTAFCVIFFALFENGFV